MISVITATYNRAPLILNLYNSLVMQSNKKFEWIVIDDGSTDSTKNTIQEIINENKIFVNYQYQTNSGKHIALNNGVKIAKGELVFFVDSDDILTENCINFIEKEWEIIKKDETIAGLSGNKAYLDGRLIGTTFEGRKVNVSSFELRYKLKVEGDKAEIFKKSIIEKYPFPRFTNEKFIPEALVFNRIANDGYVLTWINEIIYLCEYRDDGLTKQGRKLYVDSWNGFSLYIKEMLNYRQVPLFMKIKLFINYVIMSIQFRKKFKLFSKREES